MTPLQRIFRSRILPILAVALCCLANAASAGQRMALVIGNGNYRTTPLGHVKTDTDVMVALLKDSGFTVIEKRETEARDLKKAFKNFALTLTGGDDVVIYFAGNGVALGGVNYLLPVDVPAEGEDQIKAAAISLTDVLADFQEAKPHVLLALIDACRPNPFKPAIGTPGLASVTPGAGQVVMFAAATGKTSLDNLGEDDLRLVSLFPRTLQKELLKPGIALPDALRAVQAATTSQAQAAGLSQSPALFGQAGGDFQVHPSGPTDLSTRFAAEEERQIWEAADKQRQDAVYQRIIKTFPGGPLATRARERMADLHDWELAKGGELAALRTYSKNHPDGLFSQTAKEGLEQEELWAKAGASSDMTLVKSYLDRYPQGRHQAPAAALLSRLRAEEAARLEQAAWDTATKEGSEASYARYLQAYPQGLHAGQSKESTEKVVWEKASASRRLDPLRNYLERYPQGRYVTPAREMEEDIQWDEVRQCDANDQRTTPFRCDALTDAFVGRYAAARHGPAATQLQEALRKSRPEREERKALADAEAGGTIPLMQEFIDRFPNSTHYSRALEKLAALWKAKPLPAPGTVFRDSFVGGKGEGPDMIAIPGGSFEMGSTENDSERPIQKIILPHPIAVGRVEVSFEEWDACVADGGCALTPDDSVSLLVFRWSGRGKRPVININWEDTRQYLNWLSAKTGKKYRLLTEAEWEYAARAGTTTRFSFGDDTKDIDRYGWNASNSQRETHPVGSLAANAWGFQDMHGNVAEWVEDCWHANRTGAPINGHVAWATNCIGEGRVIRGASIFDITSNMRSAARGRSGYRIRSPAVGFRVARDYTDDIKK